MKWKWAWQPEDQVHASQREHIRTQLGLGFRGLNPKPGILCAAACMQQVVRVCWSTAFKLPTARQA